MQAPCLLGVNRPQRDLPVNQTHRPGREFPSGNPDIGDCACRAVEEAFPGFRMISPGKIS